MRIFWARVLKVWLQKMGHDRIVKILCKSNVQRPSSTQSVLDGPAKLAEKLRKQKLKKK